jgi:DNA-binding CsgD family transcriptional regulator
MITAPEFYKQRDEEIYKLFTVYGLRQKTIAKQFELSESQVKHIIGRIRRSEK